MPLPLLTRKPTRQSARLRMGDLGPASLGLLGRVGAGAGVQQRELSDPAGRLAQDLEGDIATAHRQADQRDAGRAAAALAVVPPSCSVRQATLRPAPGRSYAGARMTATRRTGRRSTRRLLDRVAARRQRGLAGSPSVGAEEF